MMSAAAAVRERPLLMSGPMVRAILDGHKSQTRRVVADRNSEGNYKASQLDLARAWADGSKLKAFLTPEVSARGGFMPDEIIERLYCRYQVGDRLWVREAFHRIPGNTRFCCYRASCENGSEKNYKFTPSIHMPRWASRLTLELTDVRVQRLQEITQADVIAEGCPENGTPLASPEDFDWYRSLWDSLNAKRGYGWNQNPWVWALTFRRVEP